MNENDNGIVISSRVRLARNFEDFVFPSRLDDAGSAKVLEKVENALKNSDEKFGTIKLSDMSDLQAEINRLKKFEQEQSAFAKRVQEFDKNVVYNDKAPDTEEFKKYYEEIEPDNAEKIYKEVCKDYEYSQEIKDQADAYGKMEPASAAAILSEMTNDLTLVAKILDSMQTSKSALILQNMKPTTAAQVTTKMTAMKNK